MEGQGPVEICISALSGDFDGNTFSVSYTTISGQAEGKTSKVGVEKPKMLRVHRKNKSTLLTENKLSPYLCLCN